MKEDNKRGVILCSCSDSEHQIIYSTFEDGFNGKLHREVFLHIFLTDTVWYKRIWKGLKYIFGYKCRYGHFTEIVVDETNIKGFEEIVDYVKFKDKKKKKEILHD